MTHGPLVSLNTPAAIVDLQRLKANTGKMSARAKALGVRLRPHVKTHKCVEAARYQVDGHFGGITVSTLAEAEQFADAGFDDITYAVPLAPGRAQRAWALNDRIVSLQVLVDHPAAVDALGAAAVCQGSEIEVLVKVDCGYHRAGLLPDDPRLIQLGHRVHHTAGLRFKGVLAHAGHSYDCIGPEAIKAVAESERAETVRAAQRLRASGLTVDVVSIGSTPTASLVEDLTGITELRPGNYAMFDGFQAAIGSCSVDDIALSVLTEVIGVYPERKTILIDAGALALSKDPGATHVPKNQGYGLICGIDGIPLPGLSLVGLSQEHGKVMIESAYSGPLPTVGTRLRILPNHSCLVTALHDPLFVVDGQEVKEEWHPVRGW